MPSVTVRRRTRGYSALPPVPPDLVNQAEDRASLRSGSLRDNNATDTGTHDDPPSGPIREPSAALTVPSPDPNSARPTLFSRSTNLVPLATTSHNASSSLDPDLSTQNRARSKTIQAIMGQDVVSRPGRSGSGSGLGGSSFDRSGSGSRGQSVRTGSGLPAARLASTAKDGVEIPGGIALGPMIGSQLTAESGRTSCESGGLGDQANATPEAKRERARTITAPGDQASRSAVVNAVTGQPGASVLDARARANTIAHPQSITNSTEGGPSQHAIASAFSGQSAGMTSVGVRFSSGEKQQMRNTSGSEGNPRWSGENQRGLVDGSIGAAGNRRRSGSNASSRGPTEFGGRRRTLSNVFSFGSSPISESGNAEEGKSEEEVEREEQEANHEDQVVEHLDVIDPEISVVSHLQNAGNTLMFPPGLFNRKPVLDLPAMGAESREQKLAITEKPNDPSSTIDGGMTSMAGNDNGASIQSKTMEDPLDAHVKDVLSKRALIRRSLKGMWVFLKTPLGFVMGIYGFLVVFWGAAIVLFLLGWINTGSHYNKILWIEISSQIENGLFTITGVGLIPWRYMDVYRIGQIYSLQRRSRELRKKRGLPPIEFPDDLPDPLLDPDFVQVLTDKDQASLRYQQERFMASQTWYRPHATDTHTAFPIGWGLIICLCILGNSLFQVALDGCMWGFTRFNRPAATTGTLMPASFLCGIGGAVLIWKIGERTKKKKEVRRKLRHVLGMSSEETDSAADLLKEKKPLAPEDRASVIGMGSKVSLHGSHSDDASQASAEEGRTGTSVGAGVNLTVDTEEEIARRRRAGTLDRMEAVAEATRRDE